MYIFFEYATLIALITVADTSVFAASTVCLIAKEGIAAVVRISPRTTDTRTRETYGHIALDGPAWARALERTR